MSDKAMNNLKCHQSLKTTLSIPGTGTGFF